VSALTQAAALSLLPEAGLFESQAAAIRRERGRLNGALGPLPGARVFPTETNFVLVRVTDSTAVFEGLQNRGMLVKNLHGWHPLLANCLRITVGTPEQNDQLIAAMEGLCR